MEIINWWTWIGYGCNGSMLALLWMGVFALYKGGRDLAWWLLTIGISLSTLGLLAQIGSFVVFSFVFDYNSEFSRNFAYVSWGLSLLGSLICAIGFLKLALRYGGLNEKNAQLEQVLASLQEKNLP